MSSTTLLCAHVLKVTQETRSPTAIPNHHHVRTTALVIVCYITSIGISKFFNTQNVSIPLSAPDAPPNDPCYPSPCGSNAQCADGVCTCLPEYQGDPYSGCRPECVLSTECPRDKACIRNKCSDPCPGTCGQDAICDVVNHIPMCSCPQGKSGNPFVLCRPVQGM